MDISLLREFQFDWQLRMLFRLKLWSVLVVKAKSV